MVQVALKAMFQCSTVSLFIHFYLALFIDHILRKHRFRIHLIMCMESLCVA